MVVQLLYSHAVADDWAEVSSITGFTQVQISTNDVISD